MNAGNLSGFLRNHQQVIKRAAKIVLLYQRQHIEQLAKHLQISQSFAASIPPVFDVGLVSDTLVSRPLANQLTEALNLSQLGFVDDIGKTLGTAQMFRQQLLTNQAALNQIYLNLINDLKPILEHSRSMQAVFNSIRLIELEALSSITALPAVSQLSHRLLTTLQTPDTIFREGLLSDLAISLSSIDYSDDLEFDDEILSDIEARFVEHLANIKAGRVTRDGIFQLLEAIGFMLALIVSLLSLQSSYSTNTLLEETHQVQIQTSEQVAVTNQNLEKLVGFYESIMQQAEEVGDSSEDAILLVTKRPSIIRTEPSKNGAIVARIYPNQLVEQLKRENDWIYVEYFDYANGIPRTGWVYRRNFTLLKE
jgi:hypothetical protein